ncbi:MAG: ParA family protein, partial [Solirubrobacterales bacterium]
MGISLLGSRSRRGDDAPPKADAADSAVEEAERLEPNEAIGPTPPSAKEPAKRDDSGDGSEKPKRNSTVISFANQKGGVAKTTTTLNLAVAFKESGHRVLAVDLDPQGNLTMSQGVDPDKVDTSMY